MDDASTDTECRSAMTVLSSVDSRIRVLRNERNLGAGGARNQGLSIATGEYVSFVDSDDWVPPEYFAVLLETAQAAQADIVCCGMKRLRENLEQVHEPAEYPEAKYTLAPAEGRSDAASSSEWIAVFRRIGESTCNKLFRREILSGLSFPCWRYNEDLALLFTAFLKSRCVAFTKRTRYGYVCNPRSATAVMFMSLPVMTDYYKTAVTMLRACQAAAVPTSIKSTFQKEAQSHFLSLLRVTYVPHRYAQGAEVRSFWHREMLGRPAGSTPPDLDVWGWSGLQRRYVFLLLHPVMGRLVWPMMQAKYYARRAWQIVLTGRRVPQG